MNMQEAVNEVKNEIDERQASAANLNSYLENGGEMFSEKGLSLQLKALKWSESTATKAMIMSVKTEFQKQVGDLQIIEDIFNQSFTLVRLTHHQQALLTLLRNGDRIFKEGEAISAIKHIVCGNQVEIIDKETSLCKLMKITIQTSTPKEHLNG